MKGFIFLFFGFMCFIIAASMFMVGNSSSHLSELKDFFWVPIPLGIMLELIGLRMVLASNKES